MRTVLFMAMSLNGYIARENGSEDFLSHENWESFSTQVHEWGNCIIGRKTYEAVKAWEEDYGFDDFTDATKVILSTRAYTPPEGYHVARSPSQALDILRDKGFETALVTGGATVNTAFAQEQLLDEVIINIEPAIVGSGIPLFAESDVITKLNLTRKRELKDGIVQLSYDVKNN